jgi:hypothetical protein
VPRADMVGVHMNRIILNLVFQDPAVRALRNDDRADIGALLTAVKDATHRIFPLVAAYLEEVHPGEYLASLCKNASKCAKLASDFMKPKNERHADADPAQGVLL